MRTPLATTRNAPPVLVLLGSEATGRALAQATAVSSGACRIERAVHLHDAAARIAAAPRGNAVGIVFDVAECTQRELAAIATFLRAGVTVWICGQERKPSRAAEAVARGAKLWAFDLTITAPEKKAPAPMPSAIARPTIAPASNTPMPDLDEPAIIADAKALAPAENAAEAAQASPADIITRYDEVSETPLVSEEELRALLGVTE